MGGDNMTLNPPVTKRVTLDTNADLLNEAHNLTVEILNEETGDRTNVSPPFREIEVSGQSTGVYIADVPFSETGQFTVRIKHLILDKSGYTSVVVSTDATFKDIEAITEELSKQAEELEESSSFA